MKKGFVSIFLIAVAAISNAQYRGGAGEGFEVSFVLFQNALPSIYIGSADDGFTNSQAMNQNSLPPIYSGGSNDGNSYLLITTQNTLPQIYNGGIDDGSNAVKLTNANLLPNIYIGGTDDGFSLNIVIAQNTLPGIYHGGTSDGYAAEYSSNLPISVIYIFDGTGNWNIPSNWVNDLIPPSPLPAGSEIMINPFAGDCILNVPQIISYGAKITVAVGKKLIVPGNIQ